jgi:hypothetical protein
VRITKIHQDDEKAGIHSETEKEQGSSLYEKLKKEAIRFPLETRTGRTISFIQIVTVAVGGGIMAFKYEYLYTSLFVLMACAALLLWLFLAIRFFDQYTN